jgi:glycosyltransferase involved in cell wall biosynthesis
MYCEAQRIGFAIAELASSRLNAPDTELIFVDDGSHDGTAEVVLAALEEAGVDARILRLEHNVGKGGAVRAGVLASRGDYVAFADADLSAGVADIEECFALIEKGEHDVVFTSRTHPESAIPVPQPRLRRLSGQFFNTVVRRMGLSTYLDTQCGLKAFTRESALRLFRALRTTGFAFDVELLARAELEGMRLRELAIVWRHVEASRVHPIRHGLQMVRDVVKIRVLYLSSLSGTGSRPVGASIMDDDSYRIMAEVEDSHWWFRAKRILALSQLRGLIGPGRTIVDVGCGTGATAQMLARHSDAVIGMDLYQDALVIASSRGGGPRYVRSSASKLPLRSRSADAIVSLDVVEHLEDDIAALREYARVLRVGGLAVIAVPAYNWLWTDRDVKLGHHRRYTARSLRVAVEAAGFRVERCTYFHSWLLPIAILLRKTPLALLLNSSEEEASASGPRMNAILNGFSILERGMLGRLDLPWGLSILLTASLRHPAEALCAVEL